MERDEYRTQDPTGGMTGEDSGLQANNLSPRGQGQPKKKNKKKKGQVDPRAIMQPYGQETDSRYNQFNQPQGVPQVYGGYGSPLVDKSQGPQAQLPAWATDPGMGRVRNQAMPGRAPLGGVPHGGQHAQLAGAMGFSPQDMDWAQQRADALNRQNMGRPQMQMGENQYAQQAYQTRADNPFTAGIRNAMATPMDAGMPPPWQSRNGGFNADAGNTQGVPSQRPGTGGSVDPRFADPASGYGWGGVENPAYQGAGPGASPTPAASGLHDAFKQSIANGYTDIQDTNPWQTGPHMNQLQGFNTQGWGTGERGSGTLKNRFGQIASRYDVTQPGALKQLMQDPQFLEMTGGQATMVEHPKQDLIDFDGPNGPMAPVDVIGNAVEGGAGQNWWWGPTDEGNGAQGPQAPANQIYNQALTMPGMDQMPQGGLEGFDPQQQQGQAMQFLQWLLQQQQQGNMTNGGLGDAPMF